MGKINSKEIKKTLNVLNQLKVEKKILIVQDKNYIKDELPQDLGVWDTDTILTRVKQYRS